MHFYPPMTQVNSYLTKIKMGVSLIDGFLLGPLYCVILARRASCLRDLSNYLQITFVRCTLRVCLHNVKVCSP